jgi:hypothetical protein
LKGKGLAPGNGQENLVEQARKLHQQIRAKLKEAQRPLIDLGRLMTRMRESGLWKYLPGRYRGWEDYVNDVMGSRARSSLHEIVAAYSLTQGSNPIPPEDVERMGVKRAAQVARLKGEQRTPEIREMAKTEPVMVVRNKVQAVLNQELPADEQKPMLKLLAINLPEETVQRFETLMEVMVYMEGIRDGDNTQTMRAKAFNAMLWSTEQYLAPELAQAEKLRKASEGAYDSPAASAQEDFPEEEEDHEFPDDGQAQGRLYDEGTSTGSTDQREGNR